MKNGCKVEAGSVTASVKISITFQGSPKYSKISATWREVNMRCDGR